MSLSRVYSRGVLVLCLLLAGGGTAVAGDQESIDNILQSRQAPEGVVFEILAGKDGLNWAVPRVRRFAQQLRSSFPELPIAVVSHGREMFALQSTKSEQYAEVHREVQGLVADDEIKFHVCGTYAENRGIAPEAFPEYVDVAAEGPTQIRLYEELGYVRVVIDKPK